MRKSVAVSILSVALIAGAGASKAEGAPDAEHLQAAASVERAMGGEAQVMKGLAAMRPGMINMMAQTSHMPIGQAADEWDKAILPGMQAHIGDIESAKARILAEHFTVSELIDLKNFYLSPTGQKLIANQSVIATESMRSMMPFLQDVMKRSAQLAQQKPGGAAAPQAGAGP